MNWRLVKWGSVAVLVSLRTTLPVAASATNRSIDSRLRSEKNAIHFPSGLMEGPTFISPPRPCTSSGVRPISAGGVVAARIGAYAWRMDACQSADSSFESMPSTSLNTTRRSPEAAAMDIIRLMTSSPNRAADIRPERLPPSIGEIFRVVELVDRRELVLARRVAEPYRRVGIDRANGKVFGHAFDEPQRQLGAGVRSLLRRRGAHDDVELKRVDELVADDVVGVGERARQRQDNPAPQRFGDAAGAFPKLSGDHVGLLEVRVGRVQDERLPAAQLVRKQLLEPCVPPLGHTGGDVDPFPFARVEIDIEVLSFQHLEVELLILDFVAPEVLGGGRR